MYSVRIMLYFHFEFKQFVDIFVSTTTVLWLSNYVKSPSCLGIVLVTNYSIDMRNPLIFYSTMFF